MFCSLSFKELGYTCFKNMHTTQYTEHTLRMIHLAVCTAGYETRFQRSLLYHIANFAPYYDDCMKSVLFTLPMSLRYTCFLTQNDVFSHSFKGVHCIIILKNEYTQRLDFSRCVFTCYDCANSVFLASMTCINTKCVLNSLLFRQAQHDINRCIESLPMSTFCDTFVYALFSSNSFTRHVSSFQSYVRFVPDEQYPEINTFKRTLHYIPNVHFSHMHETYILDM